MVLGWVQGGRHGLWCCCLGSAHSPARCLALPPYLGLNKPFPDLAPGAAPVPTRQILPYPGLPPCLLAPPMLSCRGHPGHESLG